MTIIDLLHSTLEAHGISSRVETGSVRLIDSDLVLEPRIFEGPPNERSKIVQLDIVAHSNRVSPRSVVESIAGVGRDQSAAENDAFGKFLLGSFHVLLTALADHSCESNPAEWTRWRSSSGSWNICDGPLLTQGPEVPSDLYSEFLEQLRALFMSSVTPEAHWVRVYVGSFNRKSAGVEVLLDNAPWPEATTLAEGMEWGFPEEYRSFRHFFMAFPDAR